MNVSALALLNPKTSRFVAVTSYRCRVRFRRPTTFIYTDTLDYIFSYTFNLFPILKFISTLYCISSLILSIVFNKISLSFTLYINSFLIPFILLWSLLKYLLLLKSLVWPLLFRLLVLLPLKSLTP